MNVPSGVFPGVWNDWEFPRPVADDFSSRSKRTWHSKQRSREHRCVDMNDQRRTRADSVTVQAARINIPCGTQNAELAKSRHHKTCAFAETRAPAELARDNDAGSMPRVTGSDAGRYACCSPCKETPSLLLGKFSPQPVKNR